MEGLLQSQGGGGALRPALRPSRHSQLCSRARASVRGVQQLAVSLDELRLARDAIVGADDHVVNGHAPAGTVVAPEAGVDGAAVEKLRAIAEAAADRAEMHDIIGRQRDNWNHLLLHSTNSLALTASVMAALAPAAPTLLALKASAGVLLATTAVTMTAVNKIQPSQLAEEQRNATRLWKQLERDVRTALDLRTTSSPPSEADVQDAMDRVLALDAAYPLPLLPGMLEKFPKTVEPTRWWPRRQMKKKQVQSKTINGARRGAVSENGWTQELENEMRGIVRVLKAKDEQEYVSNGKLALRLNRGLALAGPALAGTAALATAFIGAGEAGAWASGAVVLSGALAAAVNTVEHGGQVGMVFELFRNVAGFYRKIQEDIEANLEEADVERRENGEVFETKVALLLGRSTSDLRQFREMASPSFKDEDIKIFAGKLF
ncbi:probable F-box protein At4g22030 [Phragmites australis]|uniref:probable F-box protein At4g22030 n=1 Tax=Phragmites australis TaxID=29695 RepID=UPI002D7835EB|nr:probable F-box protein At4g22030 [Phragmites australis]